MHVQNGQGYLHDGHGLRGLHPFFRYLLVSWPEELTFSSRSHSQNDNFHPVDQTPDRSTNEYEPISRSMVAVPICVIRQFIRYISIDCLSQRKDCQSVLPFHYDFQ